MAEDLGQININILGGEGGSGGSGGIGGGMGKAITGKLFGPATRDEFNAAIGMKSIRERLTSGKDFGLAAESFKRQLLRGGEGQRKAVGAASDLKSELMGFLRNPSGGAASGLLQEGTKTSALFKSMGKAGAIAGTALLAVGVAFTLVKGACDILEAGLQQVLRRADDLYRYDARIAEAKMRETIQKMNDAFAEAGRSGKIYADIVDANTKAESMKTWMAEQWMVGTSAFIRGWALLKTATYAAIGAIMYPAAKFAQLFSFLNEKIMAFSDTIETFLNLGGMFTSWLIPVLKALGIIADNTKPTTSATTFNNWIKADIKAMTGVDYTSSRTYGIARP